MKDIVGYAVSVQIKAKINVENVSVWRSWHRTAYAVCVQRILSKMALRWCGGDKFNSLHLYSAFQGTQSTLHTRGNLLNHHQCAASTWMMRRQPYCARTPTTHQLTGGEEMVMNPISVWGWLGGHDGQRPMGKFEDAGVTPLLFFEGHPGIFNDHRESGPRFNVSSEGRCFLQYSVPVTTLGC